ncbi:L-rhamnose mutarotase [Mycolicibacterium baixiangningiae]|uniref:L-rhamnose mutarotase n=1 Tax=Mycolicibacterium baixiangningiae TaxID=2761578 RepID=UPI001867BBDA|nr:L-rhamnose mutarotase [Mycolicibacterium baixiangningiae]
MDARTTERVCFLLHLRRDRIDDYLKAHEHVWPEMLEALRQAGWRNYSLFLDADDGLVVGYFETYDYDAATAAMAATDVNDRWQATMAGYFDNRPDHAMDRLTHYFHLP